MAQKKVSKVAEKAKRNLIYRDVSNRLENAILDGRYMQASKLPSERVLAESFGIGRRTLREALRLLEQKGLIEIRRGVAGGAFIKVATTEKVDESLALMVRLQRIPLKDLAEFRLDLEGIIARRAAEKASPKNTAELRSLLAKGAAFLAEDVVNWQALMEVDRRIHIALARIADNQILEIVARTVHNNIFNYYADLLPRDRRKLVKSHQGLVNVVEAVASRKRGKAFLLAQEHVREGIREMEKRAKGFLGAVKPAQRYS